MPGSKTASIAGTAGRSRASASTYAVARTEFYAARQIVGSTRYTVREACLANLQSGHYGPWRAEYRMLCGRGFRRVMSSIPATYQPKD
jgi:hypothetical protein